MTDRGASSARVASIPMTAKPVMKGMKTKKSMRTKTAVKTAMKTTRSMKKKTAMKTKAVMKTKRAPRRRKPADPEEVLRRVTACKVIPVIKLSDAAHAVPLCNALKEGNIDVAEITFRTACAAEAISSVTKQLEGVCVGAGTVLTPQQVDVAINAGADFIVSPGFSKAVFLRCQLRGALYLPGVVTATEVMMVTSPPFDLNALKFFPASNFGGAGTLKSFSAVFPKTMFMPTGGVTESNIGDYVSLPNVMAAGGSWMVGDSAIKVAAESGDWKPIVDAAKKASDAALAGASKFVL